MANDLQVIISMQRLAGFLSENSGLGAVADLWIEIPRRTIVEFLFNENGNQCGLYEVKRRDTACLTRGVSPFNSSPTVVSYDV